MVTRVKGYLMRDDSTSLSWGCPRWYGQNGWKYTRSISEPFSSASQAKRSLEGYNRSLVDLGWHPRTDCIHTIRICRQAPRPKAGMTLQWQSLSGTWHTYTVARVLLGSVYLLGCDTAWCRHDEWVAYWRENRIRILEEADYAALGIRQSAVG